MKREFADQLLLIKEWLEEYEGICEMCPCWIDSDNCNKEKCSEVWKEWLLV